jgi:hypothetical protein
LLHSVGGGVVIKLDFHFFAMVTERQTGKQKSKQCSDSCCISTSRATIKVILLFYLNLHQEKKG